MKPPTKPKTTRLLISRTDNIGDVILTLPLAALLKQHYPNAQILFLARNYVESIIHANPHVDQFISWDELNAPPEKQALNQIKALNIDTIIHVFPHRKIARLAQKANIKTRIGSSRRWYHKLYCNQKINFSRANSSLHEAQINLKLLAPFSMTDDYSKEQLIPLATLTSQHDLPVYLKNHLDPQRFNLIIHPLSNGNGREWPIDYYQQLIHKLDHSQFNILVTGSEKESDQLKQSPLKHCSNAIDLTGKLTLNELLIFMSHCDGLIAASTGPMHMAAALGIRTLGLYAAKPGINPSRWGPLGKQAETLMIEKPCNRACDNNHCPCIQQISVDQVKQVLNRWIGEHHAN